MARPAPSAVAELLKPITWFPPMWAFGCGVGRLGRGARPSAGRWSLLGVLLAGPLVCAHQPGGERLVRPPRRRDQRAAAADPLGPHAGALGPVHRDRSGRCCRWLVALALGPWGFAAAAFGLALAWAYSAPPLRLKRNGWWGNAACGLCYEGLAWVTGAAVMAGGACPTRRSLALAALYSLGAHGIMTLNDFKSVEGDRRMGIGSLPVRLGVERAARVACWVMARAAGRRRRAAAVVGRAVRMRWRVGGAAGRCSCC